MDVGTFLFYALIGGCETARAVPYIGQDGGETMAMPFAVVDCERYCDGATVERPVSPLDCGHDYSADPLFCHACGRAHWQAALLAEDEYRARSRAAFVAGQRRAEVLLLGAAS
jgi:hypothetical protein